MFQISQPKMRIAVRLYEAIVGEKSEIFGVNWVTTSLREEIFVTLSFDEKLVSLHQLRAK